MTQRGSNKGTSIPNGSNTSLAVMFSQMDAVPSEDIIKFLLLFPHYKYAQTPYIHSNPWT